MKRLSVYTWLILSLVFTITIPVIVTLTTRTILTGAPSGPNMETIYQNAAEEIRAANANWTDPQWQHNEHEKLTRLGIALAIRDNTGQTIYFTGSDPFIIPTADPSENNQPSKETKVTVVQPVLQNVNNLHILLVSQGKNNLGTIYLYDHQEVKHNEAEFWVSLALGFIALLLTQVVLVWVVKKGVLDPLNAFNGAVVKIAANDLDFALPQSRVREIADVSAAFSSMRNALHASIYRQAELEQERRLFISAIAHDLRTPLFSLRGYLEGLEKGLAKTPEKMSKYISVCQEKAATLERLIADLFTYAQLEYLEQVPAREELDLPILLRNNLDTFQQQAEAKGITLSLEGPTLVCPIAGDPYLLNRVVENLLSNALRYTPSGGTVRIHYQQEQNGISFSVSDTGPGIDPHDLPHLFTPLYRSETSRSRDTGGAGLGLTIALRIMLAHGGNLIARNKPEGGAEFICSLPDQ